MDPDDHREQINDILAAVESFDAMFRSRMEENSRTETRVIYGTFVYTNDTHASKELKNKFYQIAGQKDHEKYYIHDIANGIYLSSYNSYYVLSNACRISEEDMSAGFYDRKKFHSNNALPGFNSLESLYISTHEKNTIQKWADYALALNLEVKPVSWYIIELKIDHNEQEEPAAPTNAANTPPTTNITADSPISAIENQILNVLNNAINVTNTRNNNDITDTTFKLEKILPIKYNVGKTHRALVSFIKQSGSGKK